MTVFAASKCVTETTDLCGDFTSKMFLDKWFQIFSISHFAVPSLSDGDGEGVVHGADDGRPRRHHPRPHSATLIRQTHLRGLHTQVCLFYQGDQNHLFL